MTSVSIQLEQQTARKLRYRAVAGDRQSTGRTAGEALDALNAQAGGKSTSALIVVQQMVTDPFFSEVQYLRMEELLARRESLSAAEQTELELLAREELMASGKRTEAVADALGK